MQKPTVPDPIQAPAGEELVLMARATGFQIYVCQPDANGKPAWTLKAPDAELFDERGRSIGKHFVGRRLLLHVHAGYSRSGKGVRSLNGRQDDELNSLGIPQA